MRKAAGARQLGINERTVYRWIAGGNLDRELGDGAFRYGPRYLQSLEDRSLKGDHRRPSCGVSRTQRSAPVRRGAGGRVCGRLRSCEVLRAAGSTPASGGLLRFVRSASFAGETKNLDILMAIDSGC